ncbi:hypothetical protein SAMN02745194_02702 [Roseomonas rosea]|uniref:Uncharacterized protein n=1 Tax=Muricoccus roseus TaxID=198092 RepID=A0A1M6JUQ6_9PROT|nr:hypothetical protein [Roseomonas rosea]SHJ50423.1 hypothetical protein SAMN02745194_02702 [Roseomonas rosea]
MEGWGSAQAGDLVQPLDPAIDPAAVPPKGAWADAAGAAIRMGGLEGGLGEAALRGGTLRRKEEFRRGLGLGAGEILLDRAGAVRGEAGTGLAGVARGLEDVEIAGQARLSRCGRSRAAGQGEQGEQGDQDAQGPDPPLGSSLAGEENAAGGLPSNFLR